MSGRAGFKHPPSLLGAAAFLLLTLPASIQAADAPAGPSIYRRDELDLIVKTQEAKRPRIAAVLDLLDVKPGMEILDIGAGTGQQAYSMAERLAGTGHVFATDVDARLLEYVRAQAKERKLTNVSAHLVSKDGLDPFYLKNRYDLVLLYDVLNYIPKRVDYLRKLRERLNPNGRVVVVAADGAQERAFYAEDVADWNGLSSWIVSRSSGSPLGRIVRGPLLAAFGSAPSAEDPSVRRAILFHLNRAADLPYFSAFAKDGLRLDDGLRFSEQEESYGLWALRRLTLGDVTHRDLTQVEYMLVQLMRNLNKLILIQELRPFLAHEPPGPYVSPAPEAQWHLEHHRHVEEMEAAGFALAAKHALPPFQAVWIFSASVPADLKKAP
ncbi:MAG: methyltransferase domain-containing protein [Elusimicrobia bacterium]|nr:methyltransferase domain-containing protein [Elusimicrobiota bacterium]